MTLFLRSLTVVFSLVTLFSSHGQAFTCEFGFLMVDQRGLIISEHNVGEDPYELPADFDDQGIEDKMELIRYMIQMSKYDMNDLPGYYDWKDFWGLLKAAVTLRRPFTGNHYFMKTDRPKMIHSRGAIGEFMYVPSSESIATGMWAEVQKGFLRFSLAIPQKDNFLPGAAIKFMRDGLPSVNTHLMPSLDGQGANRNYFANSISNKLDVVEGGVIGFLANFFELFSGKNPFFLDVSELGMFDKYGEAVANPKVPIVTRYEPTEQVKNIIPSDSKNDFRRDLHKIPVGTKLWNVYGKQSVEGPEFFMGTIVLTSQLVASEAGDKFRFLHTGYDKGPDGAPTE